MLWLALFLLPVLILALPTIETRGNAFFISNLNTRFYMKGLDYQPGGSSKLFDPLANPDTCKRDIPYFKQLGINTIRIYSIDNTANHDECMKALDDAGIYLILDTNIPNASIARDSGANCSYNTMYLNEVLASVKLMSKYNNTLGFFAANEVINDDSTTPAAPYVKAVVRDIKTFQKNTNLRKIPVGYSAADVELNRLDTAHYFNCGNDPLARVDMFGFNDYSWCGQATFQTSGYSQKVQDFKNYSIPLFFSEFGCNKITPRPFTEVGAIFSSQMSNVFSGGLVYEYSNEANNYGLVDLSSDNLSVTTNQDFDNLKKQYASVSLPANNGGYQTGLPVSNCPPQSDTWKASNNIPDTPKGALKYLRGDVEPKGNGFSGNTQWACVAGGNNSDDGSSGSGSSNGSSSSGSSGSSGSGSSQTTGSTSTKKKNDGSALEVSSHFASLVGLVMMLLI